MARPKKIESMRQSERLMLYLTPAEREAVTTAAGPMPVATWARMLLIAAARPSHTRKAA